MNLLECLRKSTLFHNMPDHSINSVISEAKTITAEKNTVLFHEEEIGSRVYVLLEGAIKLYKNSPDGKEIIIKLVKPGELFAEAILFENSAYPVTAMSVTSSTLLAISKGQIYNLLEDQEFRNRFLSSIMKRLRYLTGRILYLSAYDVEDRFFQFLIARYGHKQSYQIDLSKKEIAAAIGTIPETFSRLLMRLTKNKIITWEKNKLTISQDYWENLDNSSIDQNPLYQ